MACQNIRRATVTGTEGGIRRLEGNKLGKLANGEILENLVKSIARTLDFVLSMIECQWKILSKKSI